MILYNRLVQAQPDLAVLTTTRVAQLSAVVLVLSRAVEGIADALTATTRAARGPGWGDRYARSERLVEWGDPDDE